jgi:subtilisin family serine protease
VKLKLVTTAIAAALYSAGSAYAAVQLAGTEHKVVAPTIDKQQLAEYAAAVEERSMSMAENDGLNVQVRRQENKFTPEQDIIGEQVYIVRLQKPSLAYASFGDETIQNIRDNNNKLFNAGTAVSDEITEYAAEILNQQESVIRSLRSIVGGASVRQQFTNAINGFTMSMTQEQAALVAQSPDVLSVQRSKLYELRTDAGPELIKADTIWTGAATATTGVPFKGEGIIVGILDTGVNTDHPSFAVIGDDGYVHINPWGSGTYVGDCTKAGFESMCNDKLIGVRSYPVITDNFTSGFFGATRPASGEDYQGHGSHTAATTAGNVLNNVDFMVPADGKVNDGAVIKAGLFPQISGVAPHANIISYQVCHPTNDKTSGCPGEALLAGVEDAIKDGVDVINFSIGGQDSHPWSDSLEMAFLAAREAGIVVAAAAGNSGQPTGSGETFSRIDHSSPWLLNVAASTHGREAKIDTVVTDLKYSVSALGVGKKMPTWTSLSGGAMTTADITGVVVRAADYNNIKGVKDAYCGTAYAAGTFDKYPDGTAIVNDAGQPVNAIVACARDDLAITTGVARTLKSDNVKAGGADGFILHNFSAADGIVTAATYSLPAVHLSYGAWQGDTSNGNYGLEDWTRSNNGKSQTITIKATQVTRVLDDAKADWLAPFSSRGPSPANAETLIPAVAAPGVDIYAAFADEHPFAASTTSGDYTLMSGTSMATPHVAGAAALLRQVHPDWTPTEIQSALTMTADNVVKYRRLNTETGDIGKASTYRAGTGRINVENAVNAGLIMDETVKNFRAADPEAGGVIHKLNLPQLVNFSCKPTCTWMRKVKATKAGTWSVSNDVVRNWSTDMKTQYVQNGVTVDVQPKDFTLAEGETQTLVITATVTDTQDWFSNAEVELHTNLLFKEANNASPEAHWPMVFKYDMNNMPNKLETVAHRNEGNAVFKGIEIPEATAPVARSFKPVKADVREVMLPKDNDVYYPFSLGQDTTQDPALYLDEAAHVEMVHVPAGAKRLVAEGLGVSKSAVSEATYKGNPIIYVGKDFNGNGAADIHSEILCFSADTTFNNFCNVNNPTEGDYWVVVYNPRFGTVSNNYYMGVEESFKYTIAVVTDELSDELTASIPPSDGVEPVDMTLSWNMPDMMEGDIYYSVVDFGTSAANAGNIGKVAVKLSRGVDDVNLDVPQSAAKKGDYVPYTFQVQPNLSGVDRAFTITADIPAGMKVTADKIFSSNNQIVTDIKVEDGKITISGVQPETSQVKPTYNMTTNADDAMCRTPNFGNSTPGGYVNLAEFGIYPSFSGFADKVLGPNGKAVAGKDGQLLNSKGVVIPVKTIFSGEYDSFHLFNNTNNMNAGKQNSIEIRGTGVMGLVAGQSLFYNYHLKLPHNYALYETIAPLWRGLSQPTPVYDMMSVPLDTTGTDRSGITVAADTSAGWGIIEVDNARSYDVLNPVKDSQNFLTYTQRDDRFDYQVIFNAKTRFGQGEYEMFYAYDNINFGSQDGRGSIGLQGYRGMTYKGIPIEAFKGKSYAWEDLKSKIKSGTVVCFDYVGPESSQFEVTVWGEVTADAVGAGVKFFALSQVDGMADKYLSHDLDVASYITLAEISDQTVAENGAVEGIKVTYIDEENSANQITVDAGSNVEATVSGSTSGSTISLKPKARFHGDVEVKVTVSDIDHPTDRVTTSFMLHVETDGQNITLDTIADQKIMENGSVSGIKVVYTDDENTANTIAVTASDDVTATVTGTTSGSTITLQPKPGFSGTADVTVTVADAVDPSDKATTTFKLEVVAAPKPEVEAATKNSGGSFGIWILAALGLLAFRRKSVR